MAEQLFVDLCIYPWNISKIKNLFDMYKHDPEPNPEMNDFKIDIHYNNDLPFYTSCDNGNLPVANFIIEYIENPDNATCNYISRTTIEKALIIVIAHNHIEMLKFLENYIQKMAYYETIHANTNATYFTIMNWSNCFIWSNIIEKAFETKITFNMIPMLSYLYETGKYFTPYILSYILKKSCHNGYSDIIKWILSIIKDANGINDITKIDLSANCYEYLRLSFNTPYYTDIQHILLNESLPIKPEYLKYIFQCCCISPNGKLDIAKQLYTLAPNSGISLNLSNNNYKLFKSICMANKVDIAKWIYTLANITTDIIRYNDDELFKNFDGKYHHTIAEWFLTLCNKYEIIEEEYNDCIISCIVNP